MGGLLAQMLAARRETRGADPAGAVSALGRAAFHAVRDRRRAGVLLHVGFWNMVLEPNSRCRRGAFAGPFATGRARRGVRALCAGIGPRHLRDHALGARHAPRQRSGCDARSHVRCCSWPAASDRINPPGTVERAAALYKDRATYEMLAGMSHWLVGEPGWERVCDERCVARRNF